VSGHDDFGCDTRYACPTKPEVDAADMETPMAEGFPLLPSQLFGSPHVDPMPYLSKIKASQQGMLLRFASVETFISCRLCGIC